MLLVVFRKTKCICINMIIIGPSHLVISVYHCGGQGHRSNVCPSRRNVALVEKIERKKERGEHNKYERVVFVVEESSERVIIVLQRVLFHSTKRASLRICSRSIVRSTIKYII